MKRSSKFDLALRKRLLVQFTRPFEQGSVSGYLLDIGPRFFLLALVEDACRFNGFQCLRLSDVRELEVPHKYASFAEAALKKLGQRIPAKPRVNVTNIEGLLKSASRVFPLITIHREIIDPDVCYIGRVGHVEKGLLSLLEIGPDAKWDSSPSEYLLKDITRVDFGGAYEDALILVGGVPSNKGVETDAGKGRAAHT